MQSGAFYNLNYINYIGLRLRVKRTYLALYILLYVYYPYSVQAERRPSARVYLFSAPVWLEELYRVCANTIYIYIIHLKAGNSLLNIIYA
jgi:hypothetical protein